MRKETSSNTINKLRLEADCGMAYFLSVVGGRWKPSILGFLEGEEVMRYSELKKKLHGISERVLVAQLKELEAEGVIVRIVYPEVPPRVEYKLSPKGRSLSGVLRLMSEWGEKNRPRTPAAGSLAAEQA